jgi:hypothetical protein
MCLQTSVRMKVQRHSIWFYFYKEHTRHKMRFIRNRSPLDLRTGGRRHSTLGQGAEPIDVRKRVGSTLDILCQGWEAHSTPGLERVEDTRHFMQRRRCSLSMGSIFKFTLQASSGLPTLSLLIRNRLRPSPSVGFIMKNP